MVRYFNPIAKMKGLLLSILLSCVAIGAVGQRGSGRPGTTTQSTGNTYAIIMGVSDYAHMRSLEYADDDARLFKQFLQSKAGGEVPDSSIKIMLNEAATASNFWVNGMSWLLSKKPQANDRVYIFLAGHGDAINESEYFFLTHDCQPGNDKNNYIITGNIPLYNLKSRIQQLTAQTIEVILIIDACRTGDLPGGAEGQRQFSSSIAEKRSGEILFLSAGPNQVSYEDKAFGGGHGLFTYYLVEGLSGKADEDNDSLVSVMELGDYVKKQVRTASKSKYNVYQVPVFCCSENDLSTVSHADAELRNLVAGLSTLGGIYGTQMLTNVQDRGVEALSDTNGLYLYKAMTAAIENEQFKGAGNAREYLDALLNQCNDCPLAMEGKRGLAIAYLNYGQARINLYLTGKNAAGVRNMRKATISGSSNGSDYFDEGYNKLEKLSATSFTDAAIWMKDAMLLLDNDPFLTDIYASKITFLELYSQRHLAKPSTKLFWQQQIETALKKDSSAYMYNLAGLVYNGIGMFETAEAYYKNAMLLAPKWSFPPNNLGLIYNKLERNEEAIKYLLLSIELDSNNYNAYNSLGKVYRDINENDKAKECYWKAINLNMDFALAYCNLGLLLQFEKDFDGAKEQYLEAIRIDSAYLDTYVYLGSLHKSLKENNLAEIYYKKAIRIDSAFLDAYNNLGILYSNMKENDLAEICYKKVISIDSAYVRAFYNLGNLYMNMKENDLAEIYYKKTIGIDSAYAYAYNGLGNLYSDMKENDLAEICYVKAIGIDSSFSSAYLNLAVLYENQKKYDTAEKWYRKTIQVDSGFVKAYNYFGWLLEDLDRLEEAKHFYLLAIELDSTDALFYRRMGRIAKKEGEYTKAEMYYFKALSINSLDYEAMHMLGHIWQDVGEHDKAEISYLRLLPLTKDSTHVYADLARNAGGIDSRKCINYSYLALKHAKVSEQHTYQYFLGWCYFKAGHVDSAQYFFKESILSDSTWSGPYVNLGKVHLLLKQPENAISYINTGLNIKPSLEPYAYLSLYLAYQQLHNDSLEMFYADATKNAIESGLKKTPNDKFLKLSIAIWDVLSSKEQFELNMGKLISMINPSQYTYSQLMDYAPFLKHEKIYGYPGFKEALKANYPLWPY